MEEGLDNPHRLCAGCRPPGDLIGEPLREGDQIRPLLGILGWEACHIRRHLRQFRQRVGSDQGDNPPNRSRRLFNSPFPPCVFNLDLRHHGDLPEHLLLEDVADLVGHRFQRE